ncbi:T9SS C-terminal target domain-containing protein [candidate division KSB1 bacterium]|nr:MAG: T9SS C-terminal target domain-containing protein [candidate division KSB1 bacterium]MBC6950495.1 T9SS C-terminal target domain-containing protein [candidate division KSB1 bacterium]MCE7944264.1 T9SS C-terminal target domain-containing protein [Chlorobi bacterium CHB1]MDL1876865.1 T9SS type A sorting domain-containing protein [Cytophagia bacterium CHB2]
MRYNAARRQIEDCCRYIYSNRRFYLREQWCRNLRRLWIIRNYLGASTMGVLRVLKGFLLWSLSQRNNLETSFSKQSLNGSFKISNDYFRAGRIKIEVYNLAGQLVRTLIDAQQVAGRFKLNWDGKDNLGKHVASGVYLYELQAGNFWAKKKMILMR